MITLIRYLILTANVNRGSPTKPDWLYFSKKTFDISSFIDVICKHFTPYLFSSFTPPRIASRKGS